MAGKGECTVRRQRIELRIASEEEGEFMPEKSLPWEKGERKLRGVSRLVDRTQILESDLFGPCTVTICPLGQVTSTLRACLLMGEMK